MSKKLLALAIGAAVLLAGCESDGVHADSTAVCVDPNTGVRVDDSFCGSGDSGMNGFMYYYLLASMTQPPVGMQVVHNNYYSNVKTNPYAGYKVPSSASNVYRGVPKTGFTPTAKSQSFISTKKVNIKPPTVIRQAPRPMYTPKAPVNKYTYKAPAPYKAPVKK